MLEHGGRLRAAAQEHGIPLADWIDLSTGINPEVYPVPPIDPVCWNRLPEENDGLEDAAAAYYGNDRLLLLPGSQAAIQALPALFQKAAIACVTPIYEEHPHAWQRAGHKLRRLPTLSRLLAAATPNVLLCNPNNPSGQAIARDEVIAAADQLRQRGGWLIVDEAFADAEPDNAVVTLAGSDAAPNLLVLRSLGKFFGLAGARVGCLFGAAEKLDQLRELLGPWPLSHPSRAVARHALEDTAWQAAAREKLVAASQRLAQLLAPLGEVSRTALFCTLKAEQFSPLYDHFARRAILMRRFDQHGLLRVGLPGSEREWQRLADALKEWKPPC
ncbi:MAG: threonine-phosphate decarboxylase CobD [Betaproteobacteria bacterium]